MNQYQEPDEQSENKEINELHKELEHDRETRDLAEQIVRDEDANIHHIEEKIEELEHPKIEIFVNAEKKEWHKREISYKEVVVLAFGNYEDIETIVYAVDYTHGPEGHREGILNKGQSVPVINKMRFRVQKANRS